MFSTEYNYYIYNKELLIIIKVLENWRPELENIKIPLKIFINYKRLEYFIKVRKLNKK